MSGYTYQDELWGMPVPADGDTGWAPDERVKTVLIARLFQRLCDAVGVGVISGGAGSIVGGALSLTACTALIADADGAVPVEKAASTVAAAGFSEGTNWVHLQLGTDARSDGTDCGYYVGASETPADDAILICQVTVSGGSLTAVDNTVKAIPTIAGRIPWESLTRSYDDATTLLAFLTGALGDAYMAETADDVDTRLSALEAGGGGGGGGGTVYWGALQQSAGLTTTLIQYISGVIADHLLNAEHGGGSGGATEILNPWDIDSVNQALALLSEVRDDNGAAAETQIDSVVVVFGVYGDGTGDVDFVDEVNSTWPE